MQACADARMTPHPIYMDHHATTPVDPRVLEVMLPFFTEQFGNAGSTSHSFGWDAQEAVEAAQKSISHCIGASTREIIFHQWGYREQQPGNTGCGATTSTAG